MGRISEERMRGERLVDFIPSVCGVAWMFYEL